VTSSLQQESEELSHYEKARLENIRRNEQFLVELGVSSLLPSRTKPPLPRKATAERSARTITVAPTRRSTRVTSEKILSEMKMLRESGQLAEAELKQKELDDFMTAKQVAESAQADNGTEDNLRRRITEDIPLNKALNKLDVADSANNPVNEVEQADSGENETNSTNLSPAASLSIASAYSTSGSRSTSSLHLTDAGLNALTLQEHHVVKLCPQRMTSVALHPSPHKLIAVGGDKSGVVSIWDVDHTSEDSGAVYSYKPHSAYISKLLFPTVSSANMMYSASTDGTIRVLDLQRECFSLAFSAEEDMLNVFYSDCIILSESDSNLVVSKSNGNVSGIDLRVSNTKYVWDANISEYKVGSVDLHPRDTHVLLSAGSRTGIFMHDMRMLASTESSHASKATKPLIHFQPHSKAINSCAFSPSGEYFVSVSWDNTVKTWSYNNDIGQLPTSARSSSSSSSHLERLSQAYYQQAVTLRHDNNTGRWLSTFKAVFDPKRPATFALGSLLQPRRIELFSIHKQEPVKSASKDTPDASFSVDLIKNLAGDYMGSVNSRICFHSNLEVVLGSNSSGKVHLFR
jgi:WD40 repeat protein